MFRRFDFFDVHFTWQSSYFSFFWDALEGGSHEKTRRTSSLWCLMWWDMNVWCVMWCDEMCMWWDVNVWYVMWCGEPSGPRTRPKNFFLGFSSFGLWCVMWWDVMSDVWWDAMMCDVWCGEISSIRLKNSAQELLLCVLFFRLVMCDVVRCDVCDVVWWAIRPKNSAQELLLGVLFFRLVMCDVVRCDVWCLVRCNDVWCDVVRFRLSGPRTSSLCSLLSACDVWCGEMWCLMAGEMQWCVMCDVVRLRLSGSSGPSTRAKNFFFVFSSFGLCCVKCDVVTKWLCHVWCGAMWYVWCVMWWDSVYPAQELGPRTSSLCSLLSACDEWCGEMWIQSAHTSAHT